MAKHVTGKVFGILSDLQRFYIAMAFWKTPRFDGIHEADREFFSQLVALGKLSEAADNLQMQLYVAMPDAPSEWIDVHCAWRCTPDAGLPDDARRELLAVISRIEDVKRRATAKAKNRVEKDAGTANLTQKQLKLKKAIESGVSYDDAVERGLSISVGAAQTMMSRIRNKLK